MSARAIAERLGVSEAIWRSNPRAARLARRGLWADDGAVPPWEWRARRARGEPMTRNLLAVLLFAAISGAWAQQGITRLQCDGTFSDYIKNIQNVESRGGYVEIRRDSIKVVEIIGFAETYSIVSTSEASICFALPSDKLLLGCLNRFSGELSMNRQRTTPQSGDFGRFEKIWTGVCRPAKPLF